MPEYTVQWTIDIDGDSPEDAALLALGIQQDPESIATIFRVTNKTTGESQLLDVEDPDRPRLIREHK